MRSVPGCYTVGTGYSNHRVLPCETQIELDPVQLCAVIDKVCTILFRRILGVEFDISVFENRGKLLQTRLYIYLTCKGKIQHAHTIHTFIYNTCCGLYFARQYKSIFSTLLTVVKDVSRMAAHYL